MKKTLAAFLAALTMLGIPLTASATGGVWCDSDDANLSFHFSAASSRDGAGGWFNVTGSIKVKGSGLPAGLARFKVTSKNLSERWWDDKDARLKIDRIGTAAQGFAAVQLIAIARMVDEADYRGRYDLRLTMPDATIVHKSGDVACSAD